MLILRQFREGRYPEEEGDSPVRRCDQGGRRRRMQNVLSIARPDSVLPKPSLASPGVHSLVPEEPRGPPSARRLPTGEPGVRRVRPPHKCVPCPASPPSARVFNRCLETGGGSRLLLLEDALREMEHCHWLAARWLRSQRPTLVPLHPVERHTGVGGREGRCWALWQSCSLCHDALAQNKGRGLADGAPAHRQRHLGPPVPTSTREIETPHFPQISIKGKIKNAVWLRCEEHLTLDRRPPVRPAPFSTSSRCLLSDTEEEELPKTGPTGTRPGWGDHPDPRDPARVGVHPDPRDPARVGGPPGPRGTRPGWGNNPDPQGDPTR
ncbi:unnamed protein product, partial [Gadus morhua 'NCC']